MIGNMRFAREETVAEKTETILRSALKAVVGKAFAGSPLEYELCAVRDSYIAAAETHFNGISVQKFLLELNIALSDWAEGRVYLGAESRAAEIKSLAAVGWLPATKRNAAFARICTDEGLEYDIRGDIVNLQAAVQDYFNDIGGDTVSAGTVEFYCRKVRLSLVFEKRFSACFCFPLADTDIFLEQAGVFVKSLRPGAVSSRSALYGLIGQSPLRDFWLATKEVVRTLAAESKGTSALFSRLPKNLEIKLFEANSTIEHVTLPEGITVIPDSLFKNCDNLKSVVLPESVEEIGDKAFFGCEKLEEILLPQNLKRIGYEAFAFCTWLRLPDGINKSCLVEYNAFDMVGGENDMEAAYFDDYGDDYDAECMKDIENFAAPDDEFYSDYDDYDF